jgi:CHAT domain-containing protein/tetratricopeptide (TPR) repeat protein
VLAFWLLASPAPAHAQRAAAARADLASRLDAALAAGHFAEACAAAESLAARRVTYEPADTVAAWLDATAVRFFSAGESEALERAAILFERALALRERVHPAATLEIARSLGTLSILYDRLGRAAQAIPYGERALAARLKLRGEGDTLAAASERQLGILYFETGRYPAAESLFNRARAAWESRGPAYSGRLTDALVNCAEALRAQDRGEEALPLLERALALSRTALAADDPRTAMVVNNLAGLYKDRGRYTDAEPLLIESLRRRRADPSDPVALATGLLNLAELYRLQDRPDEAETLYVESVERARASLPPDDPDRVWYLNQFAVFLRERGDLARAEPLAREALGIVGRTLGQGHPLYAQSLHDLGELLRAEGRADEAVNALRGALAIRDSALGAHHPDAAASRVALAAALAGPPRGDAEATFLLDSALVVLATTPANPEDRLEGLGLRAEIAARAGDVAGAVVTMTRALELVDTLRAVRGGGRRSRAAFLARHLQLAHELVGWCIERDEIPLAIEAHERARARVLLDDMTAAGVDDRASVPREVLAPLEADEHAARRSLARAQRELDDLRGRADLPATQRFERVAALEASRDSSERALERALGLIREQSPVWRGIIGRVARPTFEVMQRTLVPPGAAMLVYHVGGDRSWVFLVPPVKRPPLAFPLALDSADAHALGVDPGPLTSKALERIVAGGGPVRLGSAGLAELLGGHRETLPVPRPGVQDPIEARLNALWRVLAPGALWRQVRRAEEVVIIPDGALHELPFEALVTQPKDSEQPRRYWLDDGPAIRYGASAASLCVLATRPPAITRGAAALSVSDPDFGNSGGVAPRREGEPDVTREAFTARLTRGGAWAPLPGARRETEAIRRAFAPESVAVLQGKAASEANVRALLPGRRYVHLATHGFVAQGAGELLGGLVLAAPADSASDTENDGFLQLFEVFGLRLDCELAVLSACETQRGVEVEGEGVLALSRGFLTAGARGVVASLWAVSDESTSALVAGLFERLAAAERRHQPLRPAIALRDARLALRQSPKWSDPFHWAPFVYSGTP